MGRIAFAVTSLGLIVHFVSIGVAFWFLYRFAVTEDLLFWLAGMVACTGGSIVGFLNWRLIEAYR